MKKFLLFGYPILSIALLVYSYTQVDLNLTLFRAPFWLAFQRFAQDIGYFQRSLSTQLFVILTVLLFGFYLLFIKFSNKLTRKEIWATIILTSFVLTLSYNAFSYDLFNNIFDAKIFTHYQQNPYLYKALDFPGDPMLLFMHWTHRTYPYGPVWLGFAVPLSFAGMNVFIPTLFLFKMLSTASFLGTTYFIGKISKQLFKTEKLSLIFFALNPLVLIESLVSSHNDITMMFFALLSIYFLVSKKYVKSFLSLLLSIGIKFATGLLLPLYIFAIYQKKADWEKIFLYSTLLMLVAAVIVTVRTNFQPWYLLYALPFASIIQRKYISIPVIFISFASLLTYAPFLYFGNWNGEVPSIILNIMTIGVVFSIVSIATSYRGRIFL